MSSGDRSIKLIVLQHLLRLPKQYCRPNILEALKDGHGYFYDYPELDHVFNTAVSYYETFGAPATMDAILSTLEAVEFNNMRQTVKDWYALPDTHEWSDALVKTEIREFTAGEHHKKVVDRLTGDDVGCREDLLAVLDETKRALGSEMFNEVESTNPFDDMEYNMETAVRVPTGVNFFDEILDGGVRKGEVHGVIVPTSGGKTTLGLQLADAQVLLGEHVAILSSEQRLQGDISIRCYTLAARTSQNAFKNGLKGLDPAIRAELERVKPRWQKYFHFFDLTSFSSPSVEEVFAPIYEMKRQGICPRLVIVDWWGRLKNRLMAAQRGSLSDAQTRSIQQELLQNVKDQAEILGVTVIVLHQMAGAVAERGPKHKPSSHSAQEDKNFNNMTDFCFTISKKDQHNRVVLRADKARSTANNEVKLVLDGEHCLFRAQEGPDHFIEDLTDAGPMELAEPTDLDAVIAQYSTEGE